MTRYVVAHWRGELSLAWSFGINGLVGYLVLVLILMGLSQFIPFAVGLLIVIAYLCWALVGILRSALRIFRSPASTLMAKSPQSWHWCP